MAGYESQHPIYTLSMANQKWQPHATMLPLPSMLAMKKGVASPLRNWRRLSMPGSNQGAYSPRPAAGVASREDGMKEPLGWSGVYTKNQCG